MAPMIQLSPRSSIFFENYLSIILTLAFFGAVIMLARYWDRIGEAIQPTTIETSGSKLDANAGPMPSVVKLGDTPASPPASPPAPANRTANKTPPAAPPAPNLPTIITRIPNQNPTQNPSTVIGSNAPSAPVAGAIDPGRIQVVDGDTIRLDGKSFRLVGIDAPESGALAKCEVERQLATRATLRLREIVAGGALRLDRVACA